MLDIDEALHSFFFIDCAPQVHCSVENMYPLFFLCNVNFFNKGEFFVANFLWKIVIDS